MPLREKILQRPQRWLAVLAVFHVLLTTSILIVGKKQLLPGMFDTYGTAISISPDGVDHLKDAIFMAHEIRQGNFFPWLHVSFPFHVKIYALTFVIFDWLFGVQNILAAEPLNLIYYLLMIVLVYKLTTQISSATSGLVAASTVALWPSLLLHSTQMTKDTLFICEMLILLLVLVRLLQKTYRDRKWLLDVGLGGLAGLLLWKTRSDFAIIVLGTIAMGGALLVVRSVREKKVALQPLIGIVLILVITLSGIVSLGIYRISDHPRLGWKHRSDREDVQPWNLPKRIGEVRDGFIKEYRLAGSNVGTDARITNWLDLIAYLPNAAAIGLFSPFPPMWFETGTPTGPVARKLSGVETLLLYLIEILSVIALWRERRNLASWLLISVVLIGTVLLGLVVINVGALYRQRFFFVILLITLAASQVGKLVRQPFAAN